MAHTLALVIGLGLLAGAGVAASTADVRRTRQSPRFPGRRCRARRSQARPAPGRTTRPRFAFQWLRCPQSGGQGDGSDCGQIAGATTSTYTLVGDDVGFTIRVRVTATNADGNASAASNPTSVVQAAVEAPVSTSAPQISGSAVQGQTLTATDRLLVEQPDRLRLPVASLSAERWPRDGSDCALIAGCDRERYTLAAPMSASRSASG